MKNGQPVDAPADVPATKVIQTASTLFDTVLASAAKTRAQRQGVHDANLNSSLLRAELNRHGLQRISCGYCSKW
jgi:hypothetical protein